MDYIPEIDLTDTTEQILLNNLASISAILRGIYQDADISDIQIAKAKELIKTAIMNSSYNRKAYVELGGGTETYFPALWKALALEEKTYTILTGLGFPRGIYCHEEKDEINVFEYIFRALTDEPFVKSESEKWSLVDTDE